MELIVRYLILTAYVSILIELSIMHVPSVASYRSIWAAGDNITMWYSEKYVRFLRLGKPMKMMLFLPPLLVVYAVFLFPLSVEFLNVRPPLGFIFEPRTSTIWAAIVLIVVGRFITLSAVVSMIRKKSSSDWWALQVSGPFRYSRNPGLVGMFIMFVGFWVALPSPIFLAGILIYMVYMNFKVSMEEDFLSNRFGPEFQSYREMTSRYLL